MERAAGPPNRSGPNSPYGPSPAIGRTFVDGSTRPGGSSATAFGWASSVAAIWSAATHAAVLLIAGTWIVTPQGTTSLPAAARAPISSTLTTALRFVSPVTTASGNSLAATAVALGWTVGEGPADAPGVDDVVAAGDGVGLGLSQAAMMIAATRAAAMARVSAVAGNGERVCGSALGTAGWEGACPTPAADAPAAPRRGLPRVLAGQ